MRKHRFVAPFQWITPCLYFSDCGELPVAEKLVSFLVLTAVLAALSVIGLLYHGRIGMVVGRRLLPAVIAAIASLVVLFTVVRAFEKETYL